MCVTCPILPSLCHMSNTARCVTCPILPSLCHMSNTARCVTYPILPSVCHMSNTAKSVSHVQYYKVCHMSNTAKSVSHVQYCQVCVTCPILLIGRDLSDVRMISCFTFMRGFQQDYQASIDFHYNYGVRQVQK